MSQNIAALYRSYLRQVKALPHSHLRLFFRIKGEDDLRSLARTNSDQLRRKKLKRISRDLQWLRAANAGHPTAFDRVLDIAYGRVGKLRWELMEPLLLDASPLQEKTRSPVYSPELAALLTSGISHKTRALQKHHLISPPGLPSHAGSDDEVTTLWGPLSRRREYNIRWRFFKCEWKKVHPPLQHLENHSSTPELPFNSDFHTVTILQDLFALAGSVSPSKERLQRIPNPLDVDPFDGNLPVRWLRRRYQALLGRIPLLVPRFGLVPQANFKHTYEVQLAVNAITPSRSRASRLRVVDVENLPWICAKR